MGKLKWILTILVALYAVYYWKFIYSRCEYTSDVRLDGKTVIVTGGNSGIGIETSLDMARRGARVILACRDLKKAQKAVASITALSGNQNVVAGHLELASLRSVRNFADQINRQVERLDILINNAGIAFATDGMTTEDNFHLVFGTNHFGNFLLTNLLLDLLRKSAPSRVVTVSSTAYSWINETAIDLTRNDQDQSSSGILYPHLEEYHVSKLANILFARELAKREQSKGVVSVSLHPGAVYTPIWKKVVVSALWSKLYYALSPLFWFFLIDEKSGAQTTIHCALDESIVQLSGSYFDNCVVADLTPLALNDTLAKRLWEASCEATGLKC